MKLIKAVAVEEGPQALESPDFAVCIHVFYLDVFKVMLAYLKNLPQPYDLFLTVRPELQLEVSALLAGAGLAAKYLVVENIGMDVLPFVSAVSEFRLNEYTAVLKLHTKNNSSELGKAHLDMFLKTLLNDELHVAEIVAAFRSEPNLLMVGPDDLYRSAHFMMYNNRNIVREICSLIDVPSGRIDWGFFAGTMFWIRGTTLSPLVGAIGPLHDLARAQLGDNERTGRDGTVAHGLERIWGALAPAENKMIGLVRPIECDFTKFEIRIAVDKGLLEEKIRRIGASDVLPRWAAAQQTAAVLKQHDAVDPHYYRLTSAGENIGGMDPTLHYALYGELWGFDPASGFSTVYYRLKRPDVVRKNANVLGHYHTHGVREGAVGSPTDADWLNLAASLQLFNDNWYRNENAAIELSDLDSHEYHRLIGKSVLLPTSQNFAPKAIPILATKAGVDDPLLKFIKLYYLHEGRAYDELARVLQNNDYELVPFLVDELVKNYGVTAALVGALALTHVRRGEWTDARDLLENYWSALSARNLPIRHRRSVVPQSHIGNEIFKVVEPGKVGRRDLSVLVYTTLFGDIDTLPPILSASKYCKFVCFTDFVGDVEGWEYRVVNPNLGDPNLDAKIFKVLPQEFDAGYDYTMFVDANTLLAGRIDEFIEKYLADNDFVMFKHPERSDIYAEGVAIVESERHSPAKILDQIGAYHKLGLPAESGLAEASFIWRSTRSAMLTELMIRWWQHICTYTKRDQLSLGFIMWEQDNRPKALPKAVGTSRDNSYFFKLPHSKLPSEVKTGGGRSPTSLIKSADIWFLYSSRYAKTGSTVLRGKQLSDLYRDLSGDERGVFYSAFDDLSEKVVYLTKGYLMQRGPEGVARLKARGNIILADYVDAKPHPDVADMVDVLIASSIKGFIDLRGRFPTTRSHHVTHHVDLRINNVQPPSNYVAGYFGELVNTIIDPTLRKLVQFVSVDTSTIDLNWMQALNRFSFHYAARKTRGIDDHKPFLKGFTAAHCGANMLIQSSAGDANYYLGEDYPYVVANNASIDDVIEKLKFAEESYRGPEWERGLEVMKEVQERSSRKKVASELLALLKTL